MRTFCDAYPTFFKACLFEARHQDADGIRVDYSHPGYHLAIHARSLVEGWVDDEVVDELDEALGAVEWRVEERLWQWFCKTLPRCMAQVPTRRRATFMKGVLAAADKGRI